MTRQHVSRTHQQTKSDTPLVSGILQRAAVRTVPEKDVQPTQEEESETFRESRFHHNFCQVPVSTGEMPMIQPKLKIGAVGDRYEQEADRVAQDVVQKIHAPAPKTGDEDEVKRKSEVGSLQRVEISEFNPQSEASVEIEASIQGARGSGQPLVDSVREPMEQAFGADFSGVRVHADAKSDELNQSVQAKAFTTESDIFFRQGAYEPSSVGGQELLAHELTHVVQQSGQQENSGKIDRLGTHTQKHCTSIGKQSRQDLSQGEIGDRFHPEAWRSPLIMPKVRSTTTSKRSLLVQRVKVNLTDPNKEKNFKVRKGMFSFPLPIKTDYGTKIEDYEKMQSILSDPTYFEPSIKKLEEELNKKKKEGVEDPLSDVLLAMEQSVGINLKGAPIYTNVLDEAPFNEMSKELVIPQDIGPGAYHGAYSHRIQWYVIIDNKSQFKASPAQLLQWIQDPKLKPPEKGWPTGAPEGGGYLWDAILDRVLGMPKDYSWDKDGITSPEALNRALIDISEDFAQTHPDSKTNPVGKMRQIAPVLADFLTDEFNKQKTTDKNEYKKALLESGKYKEILKDVLMKNGK